MGSAVMASRKGFSFDFVFERYQASGKLKTNKIMLVIAASLKESKKGVKSKPSKSSIKTTLPL